MLLQSSVDSNPFVVTTMLKALTCTFGSTLLSKTQYKNLFRCIDRVETEERLLVANASLGHTQYGGFVACVGGHSPMCAW
jgi:hypothetical protein